MRRLFLMAAVCCALPALLLCGPRDAWAQHPPGYVYPENAAPASMPAAMPGPPGPAQSPRAPYLVLAPRGSGQAQPLIAPTYSYGWFGVAPRQHCNALTDYYGFHWLWH